MKYQVPVLFGWLVGCACPVTAPTTPQQTSQPHVPPIGRIRTGTFSCPHGDVQSFRVAYPWPNEDGGTEITQPPRDQWSEPGIHLCGGWAGVEGAQVLTCRDAEGRFDGPVEMLAPDRSIVLQGYCSKGAPIGPWVTWRADRAVDIVAPDGAGHFHGLHVHNPPPDRPAFGNRDEYEGVLVERARP